MGLWLGQQNEEVLWRGQGWDSGVASGGTGRVRLRPGLWEGCAINRDAVGGSFGTCTGSVTQEQPAAPCLYRR